ncbi:L-histidine N-alpha-methyltransferase [Nocardioides daedukensis]|uniref:Histidine N-alpha-methyltransferase n=1 Tax=Nocardioides daedukensis TaxID=634462 RepID=A0A7Y9RV21_9ACTN|nr:L-histidine N(alpha)-methyltransferase [Nocardioides daedukensis]NYG57171.1 L-histidine N-alpha-methyltransferase [Nocardioides daedukensis]
MNEEHIDIDVLLQPGDLREGLEHDARVGLTSTPKTLPPKYFYDATGSELFEQITRLPEYYQTRTEHALLTEHAGAIAKRAGADVLLELGSGSSEKTRLLLDALRDTGGLAGYVPVDVSASALREAVEALRRDYPGLAVHGAVADYDHHLDRLPHLGTRLVAFLGGTLGNFPPPARATFLADLARGMEPGESLLLGVDLVKDPARLVAAYDDSAGVTAAFNRNVLTVLNRELGADFDPAAFGHVAVWDAENEWIEMRLRATRSMLVQVPALDLHVAFAEGEEMRTEISAKFRSEGIEAELVEAGFELEELWTDASGDYALVLASTSSTA